MGTELKFFKVKKVLGFGCTKCVCTYYYWYGDLMVKMVNFKLCVFYHNNNKKSPLRISPEGNHISVKGWQQHWRCSPPTQPHLHPTNPGVKTVFCAQDSPLRFLEMSQLQPCTAYPQPPWLTQYSRLCFKAPVSLGLLSSVGDWVLSSHPPKETSAIPEWGGRGGRSAQHQPEGGETDFPDESRSWDLQMQVKREVCVCAGEGEWLDQCPCI